MNDADETTKAHSAIAAVAAEGSQHQRTDAIFQCVAAAATWSTGRTRLCVASLGHLAGGDFTVYEAVREELLGRRVPRWLPFAEFALREWRDGNRQPHDAAREQYQADRARHATRPIGDGRQVCH